MVYRVGDCSDVTQRPRLLFSGATNVFRALGKGWGITTLLLDAMKGFIPAAFFPALAGEPGATGWALAFGCAAIAGHNWPVFLKFKGGKGVATSAGVLLGRSWGYVLFGAAGACSLYINIILWFTEKEYVYPTRGPLRYFTYYWGFFVCWGALALAYSAWRIAERL